jgi:small-conductance mechanosensitive channel
VQLRNFSANGIDFDLYAFVAEVESTGRVSSELRFALLKLLREQEIAHSAPAAAPLDTRQLEAAFMRLARAADKEAATGREVPKRAAR